MADISDDFPTQANRFSVEATRLVWPQANQNSPRTRAAAAWRCLSILMSDELVVKLERPLMMYDIPSKQRLSAGYWK